MKYGIILLIFYNGILCIEIGFHMRVNEIENIDGSTLSIKFYVGILFPLPCFAISTK